MATGAARGNAFQRARCPMPVPGRINPFDMSSQLAALYNLTPDGLCHAVDQLFGGIYPAAANVALDEERLMREAATDRLRSAQDSELVRTGAWGHLVGAWGHTNSDGTCYDHAASATIGIKFWGVAPRPTSRRGP